MDRNGRYDPYSQWYASLDESSSPSSGSRSPELPRRPGSAASSHYSDSCVVTSSGSGKSSGGRLRICPPTGIQKMESGMQTENSSSYYIFPPKPSTRYHHHSILLRQQQLSFDDKDIREEEEEEVKTISTSIKRRGTRISKYFVDAGNLSRQQERCSPDGREDRRDVDEWHDLYANVDIRSFSLESRGKGKRRGSSTKEDNARWPDAEYASLGSRHGVGIGGGRYLVPTSAASNFWEKRVGSPNSDYTNLHTVPRSTDRYASSETTSNFGFSGSRNYAWLRPNRGVMELESNDSPTSAGYSVHAQIQNARANSLTRARLLLHQRDQTTRLPRSRSNSLRSTQSEKLYPSMLQRSSDSNNNNADDVVTTQQPPSSPASTGSHRYTTSPLTSSVSCHVVGRRSHSMSHYMAAVLSKAPSKDDDVHGSSLSLVSTSSSLYSSTEERQAHEIRRLKRELEQANEKVSALVSQLATNAHLVAAFEQSLSAMTTRLQRLTTTAEQKDSELLELRRTVEALQTQSASAGLTELSLLQTAATNGHDDLRLNRPLSTDSLRSFSSSDCSGQSNRQQGEDNRRRKKKKKSWIRSSLGKALSISKKNRNVSNSDVDDSSSASLSQNTPNSLRHQNSPPPPPPPPIELHENQQQRQSTDSEQETKDGATNEAVRCLRQALHQKELLLTDLKLEALASAHQQDSLTETVLRLKSEMKSMKLENERLQVLVETNPFPSSLDSLSQKGEDGNLGEKLFSGFKSKDNFNSSTEELIRNPQKLILSVVLPCNRYYEREEKSNDLLIGTSTVSKNIEWYSLDAAIEKAFEDYCQRVDPISNLGLDERSIKNYRIGNALRSKGAGTSERFPRDCFSGDAVNVRIVLKGAKEETVDLLAFQTLIPKSVLQRYVSLILEHRRMILCGPSGTGKTYLARIMAEYLVSRCGKEPCSKTIAYFSVDHQCDKDLRQYLSSVAEHCESSTFSDLPIVIVLDNLHHFNSLGEVFNGLLSSKHQKCPFIIGTMNRVTRCTADLQLHHNFRWVLYANHVEPVKGFLARYLKRKLIEEELRSGSENEKIHEIIQWIPEVWHHLNRFLEKHSSSDVTIGPLLFLSCPLDVSAARTWFTDLWNYSLIPYLLKAIRESFQNQSSRTSWEEDPSEFVIRTLPWSSETTHKIELLRLNPENFGDPLGKDLSMSHQKTVFSNNSRSQRKFFTGHSGSSDPLLNMLLQLQEAAGYSSGDTDFQDYSSILRTPLDEEEEDEELMRSPDPESTI